MNVNDVGFPKDRGRGVFVIVKAIEDGVVTFLRYDPGQDPCEIKNTVKVFLDRFVIEGVWTEPVAELVS